jgi:hypothetical protein
MPKTLEKFRWRCNLALVAISLGGVQPARGYSQRSRSSSAGWRTGFRVTGVFGKGFSGTSTFFVRTSRQGGYRGFLGHLVRALQERCPAIKSCWTAMDRAA